MKKLEYTWAIIGGLMAISIVAWIIIRISGFFESLVICGLILILTTLLKYSTTILASHIEHNIGEIDRFAILSQSIDKKQFEKLDRYVENEKEDLIGIIRIHEVRTTFYLLINIFVVFKILFVLIYQ